MDVRNADNEGSIICPYRRPAKPAYMPSMAIKKGMVFTIPFFNMQPESLI